MGAVAEDGVRLAVDVVVVLTLAAHCGMQLHNVLQATRREDRHCQWLTESDRVTDCHTRNKLRRFRQSLKPTHQPLQDKLGRPYGGTAHVRGGEVASTAHVRGMRSQGPQDCNLSALNFIYYP